MITIRTRDLDALPKWRLRIMRKQHTVETISAKERPFGLALSGLGPCEGSEVAGTVPRGVDKPETAVVEEVVGVSEGAEGNPFRGLGGGGGELGDGKFGMLGVPDTAIEGAVWGCGPGGVCPREGARAAKDLGVGKEAASGKDVVPMGVAEGVCRVRASLMTGWRWSLGWATLQ